MFRTMFSLVQFRSVTTLWKVL